jgi:hypothetical protein
VRFARGEECPNWKIRSYPRRCRDNPTIGQYPRCTEKLSVSCDVAGSSAVSRRPKVARVRAAARGGHFVGGEGFAATSGFGEYGGRHGCRSSTASKKKLWTSRGWVCDDRMEAAARDDCLPAFSGV